MIIKIGTLIVATCFMYSAWVDGVFADYNKLIVYLLYLIIILLASKKE